MRDGVHAKSRYAERQPEIDDPLDFLTDLRTGDVEIRFEMVKAMVIVLACDLVKRPHRGFFAREDISFSRLSGWWHVGPGIIPAVTGGGILQSRSKPGMLIGRVVHDKVEDHGYGLVTYFKAPGGITVQLYEPRYTKGASRKPKAAKTNKRPAAAKKAPPKKQKATAKKRG